MKVEITGKTVTQEKKVVAVQIPFDIYEKLKATAEDELISVSDVMRRIIVKYFSNDTTK